MHYNASIGKSFYSVPYETENDLPIIQDLCTKINSIINKIISTNKEITNEQALFLALLNVLYENKTDLGTHTQDLISTYTQNDVLQMISFLQSNLPIIKE